MPPAEIAKPSTVAFSGSSITLAPPAYNEEDFMQSAPKGQR